MASEHACMFLTYPGSLIVGALEHVVESRWLLIVIFLGFIALFALAVVLTSFEILELVPILSATISWLEMLFFEGGAIIVLYILLSIGIVLRLIPVCGGVL